MQTSTVIVDIKVDGVVENTENFSGLLELDPGTERITVNPAMASVMITDNDSKQSAYELVASAYLCVILPCIVCDNNYHCTFKINYNAR